MIKRGSKNKTVPCRLVKRSELKIEVLMQILNRNEMKQISAGENKVAGCFPPCSTIRCCCDDGNVTCVTSPYECCTFCGLSNCLEPV